MEFVRVCICAIILALANANNYYYAVPKIVAPTTLLLKSPYHVNEIEQQQYYTQDAYGQYSYGYSEPHSSKQEVRTRDGVVRGSYSYLDADNKLQTVDYIADAAGFRVAATNLPRPQPIPDDLQPIRETAEVAKARAQHLAAHSALAQSAQQGNAVQVKSAAAISLLPQPVEDTPEVAAAKVDFFKRYEEEKLRHQLLREPAATLPLLTYQSQLVPSAAKYSVWRNMPKVPTVSNLQRAYLPVA